MSGLGIFLPGLVKYWQEKRVIERNGLAFLLNFRKKYDTWELLHLITQNKELLNGYTEGFWGASGDSDTETGLHSPKKGVE